MRDSLTTKFFRKRIAKVSPTLADSKRINAIVEESTEDLPPNLKKLVQQRLAKTFKNMMQEYINSHPEIAQLINKEMEK